MKILVNKSFKAIRVGLFVAADEKAGEFILDTDNCDHSVATLQEIAGANKIKLTSKDLKKKELLAELTAGIEKLNLPQQNEKSESDKVKEIVQAGTEEGLDDEDIIVNIIQAGIKYKSAIRMFQAAVVELGIRISTKDRKESANKIMVDADFTPENYDEVVKMADKIVKAVEDTTKVQAIKLIRMYCKKHEIPFPKAEKTQRGSFRSMSQAFILEHPRATKEKFVAFAKTTGKVKNDKMVDRVWTSLEFCQKVAAATIEFDAKK